MKNGILAIVGLCVWGGLLVLQGTPKVSEEIAAEVVQTMHPQAEVENVTQVGACSVDYLRESNLAYLAVNLLGGEGDFGLKMHLLMRELSKRMQARGEKAAAEAAGKA